MANDIVRRWGVCSGAILAAALCADAARGEGGVSLPLPVLSQSPNSISFGAALPPFSARAADALAYPGYAGFIDRKSLSLAHAPLYQDGAYDAVGFAYPALERGTLAVGLYRLNSGSAQRRDSLGNLTGSFRDEQTLMRLVYGDRIYSQLSWGLNVDYFGHSLDGESTRAIGGGAGLQYHRGGFNAGFAGDNLLQNTAGETNDRLPARFRLNAGYTLFDRLAVGLDAAVSPQVDLRVGAQYFLLDGLAVRLGRGEDGIGAGIALKIRDYQFDYNLTVHDIGLAQQFGLSVFFGPSRAAQREALAEEHYREARERSLAGRYTAALQSMTKAGRYQALPLDRRTFLTSLQALTAAGIQDLDDDKPRSDLRKGVDYYLEQKPDLARSMFLTIQTKDPDNDMVKRLIALVTRPEDLPTPPSFVDVDPIRLKLFKIDEYFQKHQLDLALKECREIIALDPSSVIGYVRLGSIYYALGIKLEAVKAWQYASKLDPNNADVRKAMSFMRGERIEVPSVPSSNGAPAQGAKGETK